MSHYTAHIIKSNYFNFNNCAVRSIVKELIGTIKSFRLQNILCFSKTTPKTWIISCAENKKYFVVANSLDLK